MNAKLEKLKQNPKLQRIILASIMIIVLGAIVVWQFFSATSSTSTVAQEASSQPVSQPTVATEPPVEPVTATEQGTSNPPTTTEEQTNTTSNALINEEVLKEPVSENPTLAKEEIAKLAELDKQLKTQEDTLKAQNDDAETLIRLKEEQIKILEAELAKQQ